MILLRFQIRVCERCLNAASEEKRNKKMDIGWSGTFFVGGVKCRGRGDRHQKWGGPSHPLCLHKYKLQDARDDKQLSKHTAATGQKWVAEILIFAFLVPDKNTSTDDSRKWTRPWISHLLHGNTGKWDTSKPNRNPFAFQEYCL